MPCFFSNIFNEQVVVAEFLGEGKRGQVKFVLAVWFYLPSLVLNVYVNHD